MTDSTSEHKTWVTMLDLGDGRLMMGEIQMTFSEAQDASRAERRRLEAAGQPVRRNGVWDIGT